MFDFFRKRREAAARKAELKALGDSVADRFKAQIALFIDINVVPTRHAFLEVLKGELGSIDKRIAEFDGGAEITREFVANNDLKVLIENWTDRQDDRLEAAREWLSEEYEMAEAIGIPEEFQAYVNNALADQDLALVEAGIDAVAEEVGEDAVASARQALAISGKA